MLGAGQGAPGSAATPVRSCNPSGRGSPAPGLGVSAACVLGELIRPNPINISQGSGPVTIPGVIRGAGWDGGAVPSERGELPRLHPGSLGIRGARGAGHGRFYPLPWVGLTWLNVGTLLRSRLPQGQTQPSLRGTRCLSDKKKKLNSNQTLDG